MKKVTIIDYGVGNLLSLRMALEHLGAKVVITRDKDLILDSSHIILPGVGAFSKAMSLIKEYKIDKYLIDTKNKGANILGICLGMQLLMTSSQEFGFSKGLNFIEGEVISISNLKEYEENTKIPNIGWFKIIEKNSDTLHSMLKNISNTDTFYFVHSFVCKTKDYQSFKYYADYSNLEITAVIAKEKVIGCQFHPEKSGNSGLKFLDNFIKL
jgi:imidazole glycerol-phosphate synthase subunit HisH